MSFVFFELIFGLVFILVIGTFIVTAVRGLGQWNRNNNSPELTVEATVVAKRTDVAHHSAGEHHHYHTSTHYYATFQVSSGDRMEFSLRGDEYGMLVEGDVGALTFQGTRYLRFDRY